MIKNIIFDFYTDYLMKKYHMKKQGARILAAAFYNDYKVKRGSFINIYKVHKLGFTYFDWNILELNKENYKEYMSNAQYFSLHPINEKYSHWIDDKLTLKYLFAGTKLDKYMPRYFADIDVEGNINALMDSDKKEFNFKDVVELLKKEKCLAIKKQAASLGEGFYKAEYADSKFKLNNKELNEDEFLKEISNLRGYIITEYLKPHEFSKKYCPNTINTMRYTVGRVNNRLERIYSFIRFGTKKSGFVENYAVGGVLSFIDENGYFCGGNIIGADGKNIKVSSHPDNAIEIKGTIPQLEEIKTLIKEIDYYFPQLKYLGIDIVITDKNEVKILEINSLSSLDAIQFQGSILNKKEGRFFKELLDNRKE